MSATQKWLNGKTNMYTPGTVENNWNEERHDLRYVKEHRPLPSQVSYAYKTIHSTSFPAVNKLEFPPIDAVRATKFRIVGFPGHQPEMDTDYLKNRLNTYETEHRYQYLNPKLKLFPFDLRSMLSNELTAMKSQRQVQSGVYVSTAPVVQLNSLLQQQKQDNDLPKDLHVKFTAPSNPSTSFMNFDKNYVTNGDARGRSSTIGAKQLRWKDLEQQA